MLIRYVFGILPAFVIHTDDIPAGRAGTASGVVIRIRPEYEGDEGLLQHELCHVRWNYASLFTIGVWQSIFKRLRIANEVNAYREQLDYYHDTPDEHVQRTRLFAAFLTSSIYNFNITQAEAERMLTT